MNFLGKLLRKDKASDDSSPRSSLGKKSDRSPTRTTPNASSAQSPQQQRRFADLYTVKKLIGEGSFATVHLVERKADNVQFAAKFIGKFRRKKRVDEKKQMAEVSILTKVRHRNLIGLVDFFETDEHLILVMDLATGGELFTQIEERGSFTEKDAAEIMRQLLEAVDYLHALGIAHRDLKPENVLLKVKDPASDIVITDFGLSRIVDEDDHILHTTCGSPLYVAPEILSRRGYGRPVDLWSLGVITYILLCGYAPFWGEDQPALFEEIVACRYAFEDEDWGQISDSAKDLISKLLTVDPEKRLTAAEALKHPWLDVDRDVDILPTVKKNLASRRLGKATNAIRVVNRLKLAMRHSKQHISGEKAPTDNENIR
ncbi:kinase-like domain-containing protein [Chytriomyces cf. hyalinus JEL632]|nr:kinase-like domain-containing protein [Chytriomyces cf. hyalinus JEL632]